jgi:hypothetical protein
LADPRLPRVADQADGQANVDTCPAKTLTG